MLRFKIALIAALMVSLFTALPVQADEMTNTVCPVMTDEPADETYSLEYEGQMVYFCCGKCLKRFKADPEPYLKNLPQFGGTSPVLPGMEIQADEVPADNPMMTDDDSPEMEGGDDAPDAMEPDGDEGSGAMDGEHHGSGDMEHHESGEKGEDEHEGDGGIKDYLGRFHVLLVHFPIALILVALFSEIWGAFIRQAPYWAATRMMLVLSVISGIATRQTGIWAEHSEEWVGKLHDVVERHETLGTITVLLALAAVLVGELLVRPSRGQGVGVIVFRVLLVAAAVSVGVTGHLGGELVHGIGFLNP